MLFKKSNESNRVVFNIDAQQHLGRDDTRRAVERLSDDEKAKKFHQVEFKSDGPLSPPPRTEWWVTEAGLTVDKFLGYL